MPLPFVLVVALLASSRPEPAAQAKTEASISEVVGIWNGALSVAPGQSLPLVMHLNGSNGTLSATLDSPAQGAAGLKVDSVVRQAAELRFTLSALGARYVAKLSADGQTMTGNWLQGGSSLPLVMKHMAAASSK